MKTEDIVQILNSLITEILGKETKINLNSNIYSVIDKIDLEELIFSINIEFNINIEINSDTKTFKDLVDIIKNTF